MCEQLELDLLILTPLVWSVEDLDEFKWMLNHFDEVDVQCGLINRGMRR
jgi:hypothetical protein